MLIDGIDDRGIDVGILSRRGYEITSIRSHFDDKDSAHHIFSRDCPEYTITTAKKNRIVVLDNHLKSKLGELKGASQHCFVRQSVDAHRRLRRAAW